jgi:hypothetical protein
VKKRLQIVFIPAGSDRANDLIEIEVREEVWHRNLVGNLRREIRFVKDAVKRHLSLPAKREPSAPDNESVGARGL